MQAADLISPIAYEQRLVVFFDVMGWKAHVTEAGGDPVKVGQLSLIPRLLTHSTILQAAGAGDARITSFSDCCVISLPYKKETLAHVIYGLSTVFVGAALSGFLLRAGVTVGNIHHSQNVVFGPGLNTAHDLESHGVYPRIVLDMSIPDFANAQFLKGMLGEDDHGTYVDPYALQFIRSNYSVKEAVPNGNFMGIPTNKAVEVYTALLMQLERMLSKAVGEKPRKQVGWLYARVRQQHKTILNGSR
ncbi:hypothetical protein [Pseudomonas syringae]